MQRKHLALYLLAMLASIPLATSFTPSPTTTIPVVIEKQLINNLDSTPTLRCYVTADPYVELILPNETSYAFNITTWSDYACNATLKVEANATLFQSLYVNLTECGTPTGIIWEDYPLWNKNHTVQTHINAVDPAHQTAWFIIARSALLTPTKQYFRLLIRYTVFPDVTVPETTTLNITIVTYLLKPLTP